jgi:hypothetical protein
MTLRPYPFDRSFRGSYSRYRDTMACNVRKETGTFIDRYLVMYTELQPNARTQAVGFEPFKNPTP